MRLFADADLDARKFVRAAEIDDIFDTVLTAVGAFAADAELADVEVDVVAQDDDLLGRELVEAHRLSDRLTAEVHKGRRLHQEASVPRDGRFADGRLELDAVDPDAEVIGKIVQRDKARVMAGVLIPAPRIAQPDDQVFNVAV